jgi:hypothetical protein
MSYIIVKVNQDYDYVEGVEYIDSFVTEQEADNFIKEKTEQERTEWKARMSYIDGYVDAINVPDTDYNGWQAFLKQYVPFQSHWTPKDFKNDLKIYLRNPSYSVNLAGYDPPPAHNKWNNLFIVKVS